MDLLKKYWGLALVILFFSSSSWDRDLPFYLLSLIILVGICKGFYDLMQLKKMKIVEAIVIDSTVINNDITDKNVNFSLKVRLPLENFEH